MQISCKIKHLATILCNNHTKFRLSNLDKKYSVSIIILFNIEYKAGSNFKILKKNISENKIDITT